MCQILVVEIRRVCSVIYSFNVVVPEAAGTYTVGAGTGTTEVNKVVPKNQDTPHTFVFYGLDIVVPGEVETTIATAETTAAATTTKAVATTTAAATTTKAAATTTAALTTKPSETTAAPTTTADADAIIYNLIPHNKTYTKAAESGAKNNFYKAKAGEKLRIDWTIQNDQGTAGIQMNFDFSQVEYVSGTRSTGYRISPTYSDPKNTEGLKAGEVVYTWAQSNEAAKAKDNAIIYYFTVNVPKEDGLYTVGLNDKEVNKVVPKNQETPHKFVFYGLDIQVGEVTTTPAPATTTADAATTTAAPQTTTAPAVTTADTTKATETTDPADADVLYGDVNCDGAVRIGDVVLLNRYLAKNAEVTPQGLKNANCEKDDKIDSKDAVKIKKFLALLIKETELGKKSS